MLVLTRKPKQSIIITTPNGELIKIVVARVERNQTRLGIQAPSEYGIDREEIYLKKKGIKNDE